MKPSACLFASFFAALAPVSATVTIASEFGSLRDSSGAVLSSTLTLWAIIYDADNDGQLPGGLGTNESLTADDSNSAHSAFVGRTLSQNLMIGSDKVIFVGEFNDDLALPFLDSVDLAASGLAAGRPYGFYWFPGSTLADQNFEPDGFQVGGINELVNYLGAGDAAYIGTQIPADGATVTTSLVEPSFGGTIDDPQRLTAIDAVPIPEPSAALLGALAGLLALRRRRA